MVGLITYHTYKGMGGTLEQAAFNRYETRASAAISRYTFGRASLLSPTPLEVECLMFDLIHFYQQGEIKEISSVTNDGVSVSYNAAAPAELTQAQERQLIYSYLALLTVPDGTPLLYCGVE